MKTENASYVAQASITAFVALFAAFWPPDVFAEEDAPEAKATKLAALALYTETCCPDLMADLSAIALEGDRRVSIRDWEPGGRMRGLFKEELQTLLAEKGVIHNRIFCIIMEATHRSALKHR
ncbi:hypothetical protein [Methylocystis parvus]|uniref:hypothetical protein n=1 Tax=Methylocystis parvus TaxID=134 RepID=UPI003C730001